MIDDDHASIHEQVSSEYSPFTSCYSTYLLAFPNDKGKNKIRERSMGIRCKCTAWACADDNDERGIYIHRCVYTTKIRMFFLRKLRSTILSFQNSVNNGCIGYNGPLSPFALRFVRNRTGATTRTPTNQCHGSCHFMIIMMPVGQLERH